jgi:hypothetical protein
MTTTKEAAGLERAILRAEEWAGTMPAKEAVKLRPTDWHAVCKLGREAAKEIRTLRAQVEEMRRERDEARQKCALSHAAAESTWSRLAAAEALVAEGVESSYPFCAISSDIPDGYSGELIVKLSIAGSCALDEQYLTVQDFRAAAAFIQRAKESRT